MLGDDISLVRVHVRRSRDGLYMATSPDMSGMYVAHRDINAIYADIPNIIRLWFKRVHRLDVRVFQDAVPNADDTFDWSAMAMPVEIADACLRA